MDWHQPPPYPPHPPPTTAGVHTFTTGLFPSPQQVSRSVGPQIKDQITVFRITPTAKDAALRSTTPVNTAAAAATGDSKTRTSTTRRTVQACERCHKRRTKCDGKYPECSTCIRASAPCHYAATRSGAMLYSRYYNSAAAARLAWLEAAVAREFPHIDLATLQTGEPEATVSESPGGSTEEAITPAGHYRVGPAHYYYEAFRNPSDVVDDELSMYVGFLSLGTAAEQSVIDAPAEPRYIGASAGLAMAATVNQMLKSFGSLRPQVPTLDEVRSSYTHSPAPGRRGDEDGQQRTTQGDGANDMPPIQPDDTWFPPKDEALKLSRLGFAELAFYPVINSQTYENYVELSYDAETMASIRQVPGWRLTMFAVMAIGCAFTGQREKQRAYFVQAAHQLDKTMERDNIRAIRCLLLMSLYSFYDPEGCSAWLCAGTAMRIAVGLGMHRKSSLWRLNLINQEMRKRMFWCAYSVEQVLACVLGRPASVSDEDIDVEYFLGIANDPYMAASGSAGHEQPPPASAPLADVGIALHMTKLRRISSRILSTVYSAKAAVTGTDEASLSALHELLGLWRIQIPREIAVMPDRTRMRAEAEYHEAVMLLFRPSPSVPVPSQRAVAVCVGAATEAIGVYWELLGCGDTPANGAPTQPPPPTFLELRGVFVSALTLLWANFACLRYDGAAGAVSAAQLLDSLARAQACLLQGAQFWSFGKACAAVLARFVQVVERNSGGGGGSGEDAPTALAVERLPFAVAPYAELLASAGIVVGEPEGVPPGGYPYAGVDYGGGAEYLYGGPEGYGSGPYEETAFYFAGGFEYAPDGRGGGL
ncbi:fungal-specific transcription factor domain-containing protein [Limtongia smithiae]|uniref:fungal-specific transcription factor domain-containing protein n=1 Tax=Limtongia smithiae TaxID=1125753 RepID=UPI0034CDB594